MDFGASGEPGEPQWALRLHAEEGRAATLKDRLESEANLRAAQERARAERRCLPGLILMVLHAETAEKLLERLPETAQETAAPEMPLTVRRPDAGRYGVRRRDRQTAKLMSKVTHHSGAALTRLSGERFVERLSGTSAGYSATSSGSGERLAVPEDKPRLLGLPRAPGGEAPPSTPQPSLAPWTTGGDLQRTCRASACLAAPALRAEPSR